MFAVAKASFFPLSVIALDFGASQKAGYGLCILTIELTYPSPLASCSVVLKYSTSFGNFFFF